MEAEESLKGIIDKLLHESLDESLLLFTSFNKTSDDFKKRNEDFVFKSSSVGG